MVAKTQSQNASSKRGYTPADDEILLKKVFLCKKCMVCISHFLGAKSFFSPKTAISWKRKIYTYFSSFYSALMKSSPFIFSRASVQFSSYVNGNSFYGKELKKTPTVIASTCPESHLLRKYTC